MCFNIILDNTKHRQKQPITTYERKQASEIATPYLIFFCLFVCLFLARQPPVGHGLLIHKVPRSNTATHYNRYDSSGRVISSSQRPLPDNVQHSQQTNFNAPVGIRTRIPSRREAPDPCLKLVFLNTWAAARYRTLASIIPGRERFSCNLSF